MTLYRETPSGFPVWQGEPVGEDQVSYSRDIETLWPAEALEAVGLWRDDMIAPADDVPEGKVVTGTTVERVSGVVKFVHTLEDIPPATVPQSITMRQARLALLSAGLLAQVDAAIDGLDEPDRTTARIEWEYALEIRRDHTLIAGLAAIMNLSEPQIDDLFIAAAEL